MTAATGTPHVHRRRSPRWAWALFTVVVGAMLAPLLLLVSLPVALLWSHYSDEWRLASSGTQALLTLERGLSKDEVFAAARRYPALSIAEPQTDRTRPAGPPRPLAQGDFAWLTRQDVWTLHVADTNRHSYIFVFEGGTLVEVTYRRLIEVP